MNKQSRYSQNASSKEGIKLKDFDCLGMFELDDVKGIEYLVTPMGNGRYISRGETYYTRYTCAGASGLREYLKAMLATTLVENGGKASKKSFVVLDHMANLSGKVYYEEIQRAINNDNFEFVDQAKQCLYDDIVNVINAIEDKPIVVPTSILPVSDEYIAERSIECDNLGLLYVYTSCFNVPEGYNILNAGLGGIYIGPFFKAMHGTEWTNLLKSKYVDEQGEEKQYDLFEAIVDPTLFSNGKVLLLDDNIGTGDTTREIATEFNIAGYDIKYGAVQYNWLNFYRVGIGEKKGIARFNPFEIDYLTPYNYPGHKLLKHAIAMLCGNRDLAGNQPSQDYVTPPGKIYSDYLTELKSYKQKGVPDLVTLQEKGAKFGALAGVSLFYGVGNITHRKFKPEANELISAIDAFNPAVIGIVNPQELRLSGNDGPKGGSGPKSE